jgi:hypothetical protein
LATLFFVVIGFLFLSSPSVVAQAAKEGGLVRVKTEREVKKKSKESSSYRGSNVDKRNPQQRQQKEVSNFKGTTVVAKIKKADVNDMRGAKVFSTRTYAPANSRNAMGERMLRNSDKAKRGSGLVKSPYLRQKQAKRKSQEISSYKGDILVRKRPKGAYPGSKYAGGRTNSSFKKKEKYRKRMLRKIGKSRKAQQPNFKKKKETKLKYDTRESEIWDKPR